MTGWRALLGAAAFVIGSTAQASALEPVIDSFYFTDLLESQQVKVLEVRSDEDGWRHPRAAGPCSRREPAADSASLCS